MQGTGCVLVDFDAGVDQVLVDRSRRAVLKEVLVLALRQQAHPHAPRGRQDERAAQLAPGDEIRVGDHDLAPRRADGLEVGALDVVPVAHVVAQQQGRARTVHPQRGSGRVTQRAVAARTLHAGAGRVEFLQQARKVSHRTRLAQGLPRRLELAPARVASGLQAPPELLHGLGHVEHQWTGHAQRKVQPRCVQLAQRNVVLVVDDVDATAKSHCAIDHAELAVQASPATGQQQAEAPQRGIDVPMHSRLVKPLLPGLGHHRRAHAVDHQSHHHATSGCAFQRFGHAERRAGELEDVGFQVHHTARSIHGVHQGREELGAALQQQQLMTTSQGSAHCARAAQQLVGGFHNSSSAIRGRWSDIRDQARPWGT